MTVIKFEKNVLTTDELREIADFVRNQETTDKCEASEYDIDGDYAHVKLTVTKCGDIIVHE